ncbi:MAG TPA: hypothetical protein VJK51_03740 [Candidatus Nanoarchaeia archaeon]|nr:hypothetical protein [Candidatus Nanoarchaeia archaeon]
MRWSVERKRILVVIVLFLAAFFSFKRDDAASSLLALAFLIAGLYGVICIRKKVTFIWDSPKKR